MAVGSAIEWTDATWNPTTGCTKISAGCKHCYAERMAKRLQAMGVEQYKDGFKLREQEKALELPLSWRKPRKIFVNSMSDLFHQGVSLVFLQRIFEVMNACPQHQFQVLTKRPRRVLEVKNQLCWSNNIWLGTSVENAAVVERIESLRHTPAAIKFLSLEPLLGPLSNLPLDGINWVIVGGESGPKSRPMQEEWVEEIWFQCEKQGVPFFFKQWGGVNKKKAGRTFKNRVWDEVPVGA